MSKLILITVLCASAFTLCDSLAAYWARNLSKNALAAVILLAPLGYISFGYISTKFNLAVAGGLVNSIIVLLTTCVSVLVFKDTLSFKQTIGIIAIVIGLWLVLSGDRSL